MDVLEELKQQVLDANLELSRRGIVIYTWGNASGISPDRKYMVIKPSGVSYETMKAEDMVVVDVESGESVEGTYRPSTDTPTHLELYRAFSDIGGVVHTHSVHAVAFAQAGKPVPALGTTHADYFYGDIPCTRDLTPEEVRDRYEYHTGTVICETVRQGKYKPLDIPGVLVKNHGPFTWGKSASEAVYHVVVLETIAEMALKTLLLNPQAIMGKYILDKHYSRKHGPSAYYGQKK